MFTEYLQKIGLIYLIPEIAHIQLNTFVSEATKKIHATFSEEDIVKLYTYFVPKLSPDGSCSLIDDLDPLPYNIAETLGLDYTMSLKSHTQTKKLWKFHHIIKSLQKETRVDWLGIYQKISNNHTSVLMKISYHGIPSRAEFPLTKEFARKSNNSTVGLSGKAIVIEDVYAHSGPYYKCDGKVQSELCLPILSETGNIVGIIDAESLHKDYFTHERLLQIAKVAYDLRILFS